MWHDIIDLRNFYQSRGGRIAQRLLSPNLLKFLAGLALPQLKLAPGNRIDADGNRIRKAGEQYRENGTKVMFEGMEERASGL